MAKQWQKWLDVCHRPRLEQKTAELMNDKKRRALNTFSPVKTNTSLKCTLKIPGIFEQLSDHKIATGPQRQPHRIAKNEQPLARFPPGGMFVVENRYIYIYTTGVSPGYRISWRLGDFFSQLQQIQMHIQAQYPLEWWKKNWSTMFDSQPTSTK